MMEELEELTAWKCCDYFVEVGSVVTFSTFFLFSSVSSLPLYHHRNHWLCKDIYFRIDIPDMFLYMRNLPFKNTSSKNQKVTRRQTQGPFGRILVLSNKPGGMTVFLWWLERARWWHHSLEPPCDGENPRSM